MTETAEELCGQCGHPFDPHLMVATGSSPVEGGVILCHVIGCDCFATWDVPQLGGTREAVRVPDDQELAYLRGQLQIERTDP